MLFQQGQSQQDKTTAWQLFVFIGHGQNKAKTLLCLWYTAKTKLNSIKGTLAPSIGLFICCNGLCFLPAAFSKQEQNEDKSALTQGWQSIDIYGFLSPAIKQEGGIPQGCFSSAVLLPSQRLPSTGTHQGKASATPPFRSFFAITDPTSSFAFPSTGATLTSQPRMTSVWSSKKRPNCPFPREHHHCNPSLPLGHLT